MAWTARDIEMLLARIRGLVDRGQVRFTSKALEEMARLRMEPTDCLEVLLSLRLGDYSNRRLSEHTDEWMYIFTPAILRSRLYVKLILRTDCVVISFHDESEPDAQDAE